MTDLGYAALREIVLDVIAPKIARAKLDRYWSVSAFNRRDITRGRTIDMGVGVLYEDECLLFSSQITRRFNADRDVRPETLLQFTVKLKHLG